ncbi:MAG: hypothetical protein RDU41_10440 [Clostridia bacterium]|nr:hypothetical protein [Clostridia bacterium]
MYVDITIKIVGDTEKDPKMADAVSRLSSIFPTETPVESEKPKATKRAKAPAETPEPVKEEPKPEPEPEVQPAPEAPAEPEAPAVTLEQVRAKLADLAKSGKQAEVKKLITKHGGTKLTDIPADKYAELLAEAEDL